MRKTQVLAILSITFALVDIVTVTLGSLIFLALSTPELVRGLIIFVIAVNNVATVIGPCQPLCHRKSPGTFQMWRRLSWASLAIRLATLALALLFLSDVEGLGGFHCAQSLSGAIVDEEKDDDDDGNFAEENHWLLISEDACTLQVQTLSLLIPFFLVLCLSSLVAPILGITGSSRGTCMDDGDSDEEEQPICSKPPGTEVNPVQQDPESRRRIHPLVEITVAVPVSPAVQPT